MLVLTRKVGERIVIGNSIMVTILESQGGRIRLGIDAPHEVPVYREEIRERFKGTDDAEEFERPSQSIAIFSRVCLRRRLAEGAHHSGWFKLRGASERVGMDIWN